MKKLCFIIISLLIVIASLSTGMKIYRGIFTIQKWEEVPAQRDYMLGDLFKKIKLVGMKESEIVTLLGKSEKPRTGKFSSKISNQSFALEDSLVYYIGEDLMESKWLVILLENEVCIGYTIAVT